jgi:hypothetical protein
VARAVTSTVRIRRRSRHTRRKVVAGDIALLIEADAAKHGIELQAVERLGDRARRKRARLLDGLRPGLNDRIGAIRPKPEVAGLAAGSEPRGLERGFGIGRRARRVG